MIIFRCSQFQEEIYRAVAIQQEKEKVFYFSRSVFKGVKNPPPPPFTRSMNLSSFFYFFSSNFKYLKLLFPQISQKFPIV